MDPTLKQAFIYWRILKIIGKWDELEESHIAPKGLRDRAIHEQVAQFALVETFEQLEAKQYRELLASIYGRDMGTSPLPICQAMMSARRSAGVNPQFRCFAEILAWNQSELPSSYALQHWLRSRNTLAFLSIWETRNNPTFQPEQAATFIREAHNTNTTITLKKWIMRTGATGIVAVPGRYGGTYADPIIANDFEAWLSPEHCHQSLEKDDDFVSPEFVLDLFENLPQLHDMPDGQHAQYVIGELVTWLQNNNADIDRLALLEWRLYNILEHGATAKTLFYQIASTPTFFMEIIKTLYKRHDGIIEEEHPLAQDALEKKEALVHHSWRVLYEWNTMPGVQLGGSFDSKAMDEWIAKVKTLSRECSRFEVAMTHLGHVAYYAPPDENGFFINEAVAAMLAENDAVDQRDGYRTQVVNARGVHWVDPTGDAEFALEKAWRNRAEEADKKGYFLFGTVLRQVAEGFHHEGEHNVIRDQKYKLLDSDE